jgi:hypothetical protein
MESVAQRAARIGQRPAPTATDENSIAGKIRSLNDTLSLSIFFNRDFASGQHKFWQAAANRLSEPGLRQRISIHLGETGPDYT